MSSSADNGEDADSEQKPDAQQPGQEQRAQEQRAQDQHPERVQEDHDAHLEDEEKVLAGRHDANYPALLTRDVPGG